MAASFSKEPMAVSLSKDGRKYTVNWELPITPANVPDKFLVNSEVFFTDLVPIEGQSFRFFVHFFKTDFSTNPMMINHGKKEWLIVNLGMQRESNGTADRLLKNPHQVLAWKDNGGKAQIMDFKKENNFWGWVFWSQTFFPTHPEFGLKKSLGLFSSGSDRRGERLTSLSRSFPFWQRLRCQVHRPGQGDSCPQFHH